MPLSFFAKIFVRCDIFFCFRKKIVVEVLLICIGLQKSSFPGSEKFYLISLIRVIPMFLVLLIRLNVWFVSHLCVIHTEIPEVLFFIRVFSDRWNFYGYYRIKPRLSRFSPLIQRTPRAFLPPRLNLTFCPPVNKANSPHQMATVLFESSFCWLHPATRSCGRGQHSACLTPMKGSKGHTLWSA